MLDQQTVPAARLWTAVFAGYLALGATLQLLPTWRRWGSRSSRPR